MRAPFCYLLAAAILLFTRDHTAAADDAAPPLTREAIGRLLETLRTGDTPDIYAAIYYPDWKTPLDGLRSVTAELVAEHASAQLKSKAATLEVRSDPITIGEAAVVILKRKLDGQDGVTLVPAYLHLSADGKPHWGFLALPLPYRHRPLGIPADDQFMAGALSVEHGFESKLYEFAPQTLASFKKLRAEAASSIAAAGGQANQDEELQIGQMVNAIRAALDSPGDPGSLEVVARYGTDSRHYTMIRGWLREELAGTQSQLDATRDPEAQAKFRRKVEFLKAAIRRIDLE